jgi:hypothetical protein
MAIGTGERPDIKSLPGMVRWYSPSHLVSTGWRSIVSEIFGQYADQRIMQATIDGFTPDVMDSVVARYNYTDARALGDGNTVWVDYVADLGDGFDSTYAVASLISAPSLDVKGAGTLPGGRLLIMGGDQVYPYPTRKDYRERFAFPYQAALPASADGSWRRLLFVIPGNHDWYDGLNSFDFMFCKARFGQEEENRLGGWLCPQHRSYFAVRLPHNWWIWGADIQLAQYLDAGQVLYFKGIAKSMSQHPTEVAKIILCTAEPTWNKDLSDIPQGEDNLSQIARIATDAGARICAVVAGDYHHYSRYFAEKTGTSFITAGGGGAYLSPTHPLRTTRKMSWQGEDVDLSLRCRIRDGEKTHRLTCWPSRTRSRLLGLSAVLFPFRNYGFAVCFGFYYWLMTWLMGTTRLEDSPWNFHRVSDIMTNPKSDFTWFPGALLLAPLAAANNFNLGVMSLLLAIVLYFYADDRYGRRVKALAAGLHWLAHIAAMLALYYVVALTSEEVVQLIWPIVTPMLQSLAVGTDHAVRAVVGSIVVFPIEMILIGGFVAGLIWGLYLTISSLFGLHSDQAFASMGIPDYKNFLRFKVEPNKLTIFPVGLRRVPKRWGWRYATNTRGPAAERSRILPLRPLRPHLIEGPIEIHVADVRGADRPPSSPPSA